MTVNLRKTILLVVSVMFLVTACQSAAVAPASTATQSTLAKVQAAGVVRVGIRFDNPPLSYIDANGNWVGFDVDLANEVAGRLGVKIEQVKVDETTRISFLQEGKIEFNGDMANLKALTGEEKFGKAIAGLMKSKGN